MSLFAINFKQKFLVNYAIRHFSKDFSVGYGNTTKNIWINNSTRFVVQGMTGFQGSLHTRNCLAYKTNIVGGINPHKAGTKHLNLPVFKSCMEAKEKTGANASLLFVPAPYAKNAIIEAIDSKFDLVIAITEGIPQWDMIEIWNHLQKQDITRLIGPNCPGIIAPEKALAGIMPADIHLKGNVGVVSRSGTLTYEAVSQLSGKNIGQSLVVGIGGDPISGTNFIDVVKEFILDKDTKAIVLIGEIGGNAEEEVADYLKSYNWDEKNSKLIKPVVSYIAGVTAPPGKRMGHAGAIISGETGSAETKIRKLRSVGVKVVDLPTQIGSEMQTILNITD